MTYKISETTLTSVFKFLTEKLSQVSDFPELEAELLLCSILDISKEYLIKNNNKNISSSKYLAINKALQERLAHTPLEYITCTKNFYGREFYVDPSTLIPRPETEILVEVFIENILKSQKSELNILEIGIGSGCIFVTIASELSKLNNKSQFNFYLTDISEKAISVAEKNLSTLLPTLPKNMNFYFFKANILPEELKLNGYDFIISNPPYIPTHELEILSEEVKKEPLNALDGGKDGMDIYKKILERTKEDIALNGTYFFELHYLGGNKLKQIFRKIAPEFKDIRIVKDLNKLDRVLIAQH